MLRLPLPGFPDGLRGIALLLLRASAAAALAHHAMESWMLSQAWWSILLSLSTLGVVLGLFTSSVALAACVIDIAWMAIDRSAEGWSVFLAASILVALAVLGPGAYALDRWLFGRKRLTIGHLPH